MIKSFMLEKAPVEKYTIKGVEVNVRRDDLAFLPPLPPNAKMAALYKIVEHAYMIGYSKVVMFAKKQTGTPYAIGLPPIVASFGMKCVITYPGTISQSTPRWIANIENKEALTGEQTTAFQMLHPNMITVNVNQSKKIAEQLDAYFIPFGFDSDISVNTHADKFELPNEVGTLVLSTMTGMILAGVLKQIYTRGYNVQSVYGISSGRKPESIYASISKYIPWNAETMDIQDKTKVIEAFERSFFIDQTDEKLYPFLMHPDYEAKAWTWLITNIEKLSHPIWFINSGR